MACVVGGEGVSGCVTGALSAAADVACETPEVEADADSFLNFSIGFDCDV